MLDIDCDRAVAFDVDLVVGGFRVDSGQFGWFGGSLGLDGQGLLLLLMHLMDSKMLMRN